MNRSGSSLKLSFFYERKSRLDRRINTLEPPATFRSLSKRESFTIFFKSIIKVRTFANNVVSHCRKTRDDFLSMFSTFFLNASRKKIKNTNTIYFEQYYQIISSLYGDKIIILKIYASTRKLLRMQYVQISNVTKVYTHLEHFHTHHRHKKNNIYI